MKKFGMTIAMATMLTIGGVYATFNYAQVNVTEANETLSLGIEAAVTDTPKGTINITSTFTMTVDDKGLIDGSTSTYVTGLKTSGSFVVNFTPSSGADADVRDNGIVLEMTISLTGNSYDSGSIFATSGLTSEGKVTLNSGNKVNGDYTVNLLDYLALSEHTLDTKAKYDAYKTQLDATVISVTIGEKN